VEQIRHLWDFFNSLICFWAIETRDLSRAFSVAVEIDIEEVSGPSVCE